MHQNLNSVQVVILCGGMGTRLREETEFRPKPLVEVGGKPILWHIMKIYSAYGFNKFILCLGYKGYMIKEYFVNYRLMTSDFTLRLQEPGKPCFHSHNGGDEDWQITFIETGSDAMTGARVKRVERHITGENFMLTYGDGVGNMELDKLWDFHQKHGKIGTVTGVLPISRYGELAVDGGRVNVFSEKPRTDEGYISGGFFVFQRRFLDYLSAHDDCVLERDPLERLVRDEQLMSYIHRGFWRCMDTYRDSVALNDLWKKGAPWRVWEE